MSYNRMTHEEKDVTTYTAPNVSGFVVAGILAVATCVMMFFGWILAAVIGGLATAALVLASWPRQKVTREIVPLTPQGLAEVQQAALDRTAAANVSVADLKQHLNVTDPIVLAASAASWSTLGPWEVTAEPENPWVSRVVATASITSGAELARARVHVWVYCKALEESQLKGLRADAYKKVCEAVDELATKRGVVR